MKHIVLAKLKGRLIRAQVLLTKVTAGRCKCGAAYQEDGGWYGCHECGIVYSVRDLKKAEEAEKKATAYAAAL